MSMSLETMRTQPAIAVTERELRVIALHSKQQDHIIMPHSGILPHDFMQEGETTESSARRIAHEVLNLSGMKTVAHLYHESGASAQVLEASHGVTTDLRAGFAARAINLGVFLQDAAIETYDEIDLALIRAYAAKSGYRQNQ